MSSQCVIIEEGALLDLLLPSIECAVSPVREGDSKEGYEVGGVLWGTRSVEKSLFSVRKASVIRLGEHGEDSVYLNPDSIELMRRVADTYWPHLDFLGTFHSHPWMHKWESQVVKDNLYKQSTDDKSIFRNEKDYYLDVIVSVCKAKKDSDPAGYANEGSKEDFSATVVRFGGISSIVKVYGKTRKGRISENILVVCPSITGAYMPSGDVFSSVLD